MKMIRVLRGIRWRSFRIGLLVVLSLCIVGGISQAAFDPTTLNYGSHSATVSLDPQLGASNWDYLLLLSVYEGLLQRGKGTSVLEPLLATSWEVSEDSTVFTFKLRKGVPFHDGTLFDAQAVKNSLETLQKEQKGKAWAIEGLEKIEVLDDYTIRLTLGEPNGIFLAWIGEIQIVSITPGPPPYETGVGTGPYKLQEWIPGVKVVLGKFDDYWGGWEGKHLTTVVRWDYNEASTQRLMLEGGDLDIIHLFSAEDIEAYKENPDIIVVEEPVARMVSFRMNCVVGPLADVRVRRAFAYALDYDMIQVVNPGLSPTNGPVPASLIGGWTPEHVINKQDLDKAKQLLAEAGYKPGDIKLTIVYTAGVEWRRVLAEVWQANLKEIGVELEITPQQWPPFYAKVMAWQETRDPERAVEVFVHNWSTNYPDAHAWLRHYYRTGAAGGGHRNFLGYSNPAVDLLMDVAVQTADPDRHLKLQQAAIQLITLDQPDVNVGLVLLQLPMRKEVKGFYADALNMRIPFYNMYKETE